MPHAMHPAPHRPAGHLPERQHHQRPLWASPARPGRRLRVAACRLALVLPLAPLPVLASEIAVNLQLAFNEQASFAEGIDRSLAFDPGSPDFSSIAR